MASPTHLDTPDEGRVASTWDLHRLFESYTKNDNDVASERLIRLNSLYGKDAPRDHFAPTSESPKTLSAAAGHSLEQEIYLTNMSSIESADSEKAVKGSDDGSQTDGRATFQEATVTEVAGDIHNDSSDELYRLGEEGEAIIKGTDRALSDYFGSHFDGETENDLGFWPLLASNREEAEAMVEGLERAHWAVQTTFEEQRTGYTAHMLSSSNSSNRQTADIDR